MIWNNHRAVIGSGRECRGKAVSRLGGLAAAGIFSQCSSCGEFYVSAQTHSLGKQTVLFDSCLQQTGGSVRRKAETCSSRNVSQPLGTQGPRRTSKSLRKVWMNAQMKRGTCVSSFKRKEILTPAIPWMNLEDVTLSEISQSQKDKYRMICSYAVQRTSNSER